jgi:hypothetical protein
MLATCLSAAVALVPSLVRAQAKDQRTPAAWEDAFVSYARSGQPDSALASLHSAMVHGDSAARVARLARHEGNAWYRRGAATSNPDTVTVAIRYLAYADSVESNELARYLIAEVYVSVGTIAEKAAVQTGSCKLARMAQSNWTQALPSSGRCRRDFPWTGRELGS